MVDIISLAIILLFLLFGIWLCVHLIFHRYSMRFKIIGFIPFFILFSFLYAYWFVTRPEPRIVYFPAGKNEISFTYHTSRETTYNINLLIQDKKSIQDILLCELNWRELTKADVAFCRNQTHALIYQPITIEVNGVQVSSKLIFETDEEHYQKLKKDKRYNDAAMKRDTYEAITSMEKRKRELYPFTFIDHDIYNRDNDISLNLMSREFPANRTLHVRVKIDAVPNDISSAKAAVIIGADRHENELIGYIVRFFIPYV